MRELTLVKADGWVKISNGSAKIQRLHKKPLLYKHSATQPLQDDMSGFRIITNDEVESYGIDPCYVMAMTESPVSIAVRDVFEAQHNIGVPGRVGFGVGAIPDSLLPSGFVKAFGHDEVTSPSYGNVTDPNGSIMVWIPKFYFKWNTDNTVEISSEQLDGYIIHRAFIDGGNETYGFFIDKFQCGNVNGIFVSQLGIDPCSTNSAHNPIASLTVAPSNNYGGLYAAVVGRGSGYNLTSLYQYNALAILAFAQGKATTSIAECAFIDKLPHFPKGCNNNALQDSSDSLVTYTASGYDNCALTGSGVPFAKTTHNGQSCGVADINGNMWEVASGFIKFGTTDAIFKTLKPTVVLSSIVSDNTLQGSGGAYDPDLYDDLDLTGVIGADLVSKYGNGTEQVFEMSTDTTSEAYIRTSFGIPLAMGKSAGGSTDFGNDYFREYWRDQMAPLVGGNWYYSSNAGVLALYLSHARTSSSDNVGGRASFIL